MELKGRTAVITGAGTGIGKLMARYFAAEKVNVALVDIQKEAIDEVAEEIRKQGGRASSYLCDISNRNQVATTTDAIKKDYGNVDLLVNNAGIVIGRKFTDLTIEEMEKTMQVNYWGHLYFTKEFLPDMIRRKQGTVVNIASAGGLLGMPSLTDYSAAKFAEVGFSEALRRELKKDQLKGVKVICVCPYVIDTGMFAGFKPMILNPLLKPEYVARKIVAAVKNDKAYVMLPPFSMFLMRFIKLLPTSFLDWSLQVTGLQDSMNAFKGRKERG